VVAADETPQQRMRRLEAVLFLSREPLPSRKLSQYANLADGTEARTLIRRLNQWYDESGRAFRIEEAAGGYRLMTRPKFATWLRRLGHVPAEVRLSAPALETLAVVAYRQPVLKAAVEAIRGVNCGEVLRQLMERDLIRIVGRSDELGRPYLYGPTKRFLEVFGLRSLEDLPRVEQITQPMFPFQKENVAVTTTIREYTEEQDERRRPGALQAAGLVAPVAAADDDEEFEDDEIEDDDDLDEDLGEGLDDDGDLDEDEDEDEDWDYDEDDSEEFEDEEFEDEEWEEVEGDDEELDEEEDDWEDDEEEDEDWEDD
jgi:segregation and condensation protein B